MTDDYWVYAHRKHGEYPEYTSRGGKWLIFVSSLNLDALWTKIKNAVENGSLGGMAKAPAKRNPPFQSSNHGVICVYTYDWEDVQDVKRIRQELRRLGIRRKISYKTDEDTEQGMYRANSGDKISKYYE